MISSWYDLLLPFLSPSQVLTVPGLLRCYVGLWSHWISDPSMLTVFFLVVPSLHGRPRNNPQSSVLMQRLSCEQWFSWRLRLLGYARYWRTLSFCSSLLSDSTDAVSITRDPVKHELTKLSHCETHSSRTSSIMLDIKQILEQLPYVNLKKISRHDIILAHELAKICFCETQYKHRCLHIRTSYPYEHHRETGSKKLIRRVLRLTKSPYTRSPRCWREHRLPPKNITFMRHQSVESRI
jgi:hypothetical protein